MTEFFSIASAATAADHDQRNGVAWPDAGVLQIPAGFDPDRAWRAVMQRDLRDGVPQPARPRTHA